MSTVAMDLPAHLDERDAAGVISWAAGEFGDGLVFTSSFEDPVLVHLVAVHAPRTPIVLLDTQYLFADVESCCHRRKVEPLQRALSGKAAWITGIRRVDGPTRADAPVVAFDATRDIVKINPLAAWSDGDLASYVIEHQLPVNPLTERGYPSIGCWPCTRPVAPGEDKRAGRWSGQAKTECGLHVGEKS